MTNEKPKMSGLAAFVWNRATHGDRMAGLRVMAGLSQEEAAAMVGMSRVSLSCAERGRRKWNGADWELLQRYALALRDVEATDTRNPVTGEVGQGG